MLTARNLMIPHSHVNNLMKMEINIEIYHPEIQFIAVSLRLVLVCYNWQPNIVIPLTMIVMHVIGLHNAIIEVAFRSV